MKIVLSMVRDFLLPRKKAVAAFVAPIIVANLARFVPGVHVDPSIVQQVVVGFISMLAVHTVPNVAG